MNFSSSTITTKLSEQANRGQTRNPSNLPTALTESYIGIQGSLLLK
jgi:hypothetical protein